MNRWIAAAAVAVALGVGLAGPALADPHNKNTSTLTVACDNGQTVEFTGVTHSAGVGLQVTNNSTSVMVIMSATDYDPITGEVLFSFSTPFVDKQPVTTCEGFIPPGLYPFLPNGANVTLEVMFTPRQ